jgi:drug/metabolite transporter (DMT)-like permease
VGPARLELVTDVALVLALLSAVLYGTADFLGGVAARRTAAISATAAAQGCGFVLIAMVAPFFPGLAPDAHAVAWGLGAGATGAVGVGLLYYGLAVGRVSVVAPITAVCSIAVPVLVALGLGERPGPLAVVGIAVAVASVALISRGDGADTLLDSGSSPSAVACRPGDRSLPIGLASGVAIGAFLVCLARAGTASGLWPLVVARGASTVVLYAAARVARAPLRIPRPALATVVWCGAIDVLANALYVVALRGGSLGLVATLASLYPASTVLLARIVLRERLRPVQSLGLACATVAVVLITTR